MPKRQYIKKSQRPQIQCAKCEKRFDPTDKQWLNSRRGKKSYCDKICQAGGTILERFLKRTRRLENGCLEWTGPLTKNGYGYMSVDGRHRPISHVAWFLHYGVWPPPGMVLDHICHPNTCSMGNSCPHRRCAEWSHVRLTTNAGTDVAEGNGTKGRSYAGQAVKDRSAARNTCKHGHKLTPQNTYKKPNGNRECRQCRTEHKAAWDTRRRTKSRSGPDNSS